MGEFFGVVTDIREESRDGGRQRWQMALDRTEFAVGDVGVLEAVARSGTRLVVPVLGVVRDGAGEVWHVVEKPLAAGTAVTGRVSVGFQGLSFDGVYVRLRLGVGGGLLVHSMMLSCCLGPAIAVRDAKWWGAVAQLGERLVRNEEVSGSIPLSSTKTILNNIPESPKASGKAGFFLVFSPGGTATSIDIWGHAGAITGHLDLLAMEMAPTMPLTDVIVRNAKPTGKTRKLSDERGLYLEVSPTGSKWWRLKYRFDGKEKRLALGVGLGLKDARERREAARKLLANGVDPGSTARRRSRLASVMCPIASRSSRGSGLPGTARLGPLPTAKGP